jgi:hypothetical protein
LIRALAPHTEADPHALLVQFLVGYGNVIGRSAHFMVEATRHALNLYAVLVGATSKARKGTSWGHNRRVLSAIDSEWALSRIQSGLSSGEGLVWAIRDPILRLEPIKEKGRVTEYQEVIADHGVDDKRLLVLESEFSSTLRAIGRDGNTLSALLRQAWDDGNLRGLTKNSPAAATGAHISVIGHITREELQRDLTDTEAANGFGNRFLWVCARRSKLLPEGGWIDLDDLSPLTRALTESAELARSAGELRRDDAARELWRETYAALSEGRPGLLGAITSRAEAQVMRLACIYALLDRSVLIQVPHLEAALAIWRYCEDSCRFIFGDSLGDPVADELLAALQDSSQGLTRTDIRDHFKRHASAGSIDRALKTLAENGLARSRPEITGGRPAERWWAVRAATNAT